MIARTWHGVVPVEKAAAYAEFLAQRAIPDYTSTPGNRGVYIMRRTEGRQAHFLLLSLWDSEAAIRAFAGDRIELARYYPEDPSFLVEMEPFVTHYEVLSAPRAASER